MVVFGLPAQQLAPNGQGGGLGLGLRAQQLAPDDQGWWWYLAFLSQQPSCKRSLIMSELCQKQFSETGKLTLLHINAVQPRKWWYLASLPSSSLQMAKVVVWDLAFVPSSLLQMIKDGGGTRPSHLSNPAVREASS